MKWFAVFISPLIGILFLIIPFRFMDIISANNLEGIQDIVHVIGFNYIVALVIQIFIVEIIMITNDFFYTLKGYCLLAFLVSICIPLIVSFILGNHYFLDSFQMCSIYSIFNILTYNQLFFKRFDAYNSNNKV